MSKAQSDQLCCSPPQLSLIGFRGYTLPDAVLKENLPEGILVNLMILPPVWRVDGIIKVDDTGVVLGDIPFPPGMEVTLDPTNELGPTLAIPADLRQDLKPDHGFLSWLVSHFNPNTMVFRFDDSEVTPTYEEMCAVMGHHPKQDETPAFPPGPRYDLTEAAALCPIYLPGGIDPVQGLPLEPFLNRVLSMDANPSWVRACCFLLLNMYAMKNCQPGIGDF
ncbi:hypothetical protein JCGZ_02429 [Jatropha curcas]|uniref:Aminotransferase-like plant mobile domain-containing protein n=1 Tax=Jatropha curcas TaxID=180498 RepID=A0A067LHX2_JATCU|nr:hypothetical protein JCGZ_02429 [Jatropha curcas]